MNKTKSNSFIEIKQIRETNRRNFHFLLIQYILHHPVNNKFFSYTYELTFLKTGLFYKPTSIIHISNENCPKCNGGVFELCKDSFDLSTGKRELYKISHMIRNTIANDPKRRLKFIKYNFADENYSFR